jgi:prolyl-tRNA editing enzyme YbaK/EbsC (Cys-tRNA(Pro) deacylase)
VAHEVVHLRRRIDDAAELPEVLGVAPETCLAVRLYGIDDDALLAALIPADRTAATTALARVARVRRVEHLPPARVSALTEFHPSLVPPFCLPDGVRTVADRSLRSGELLYTTTGDGSTALKVLTEDLFGLARPAVGDLVEPGVVLETRRLPEDGWRGAPLATASSLRR